MHKQIVASKNARQYQRNMVAKHGTIYDVIATYDSYTAILIEIE